MLHHLTLKGLSLAVRPLGVAPIVLVAAALPNGPGVMPAGPHPAPPAFAAEAYPLGAGARTTSGLEGVAGWVRECATRLEAGRRLYRVP